MDNAVKAIVKNKDAKVLAAIAGAASAAGTSSMVVAEVTTVSTFPAAFPTCLIYPLTLVLLELHFGQRWLDILKLPHSS